MGQLKVVTPGNVRQIKPARARIGDADAKLETKPPAAAPSRIEPPLTPEHIELIKACAEKLLRTADGAPAAQIAQRFAPRAQPNAQSAAATIVHDPVHESKPARGRPEPQPANAVASSLRRLMLVVIAAALLPNLTVAALWLGLLEPLWSRQVAPLAEVPAPAGEAAAVPPVLSASETLETKEASEIPFPVALDGTDGVPPGSVISVSGLPRGSALSAGRAHNETEWILKPGEIGDLHLALPIGASGQHRLTLRLLAPNNGILADTSTLLKVVPDPSARVAQGTEIESPPPAEASSESQSVDAAAEMTGSIQSEETASTKDASLSDAETPPLPARRPDLAAASQDGNAEWVKPTAYVNLRDSPSSSGRVLGTVAKGAKLRVLARKSGWVQVASPGTSRNGWIYSGNVSPVR